MTPGVEVSSSATSVPARPDPSGSAGPPSGGPAADVSAASPESGVAAPLMTWRGSGPPRADVVGGSAVGRTVQVRYPDM